MSIHQLRPGRTTPLRPMYIPARRALACPLCGATSCGHLDWVAPKHPTPARRAQP